MTDVRKDGIVPDPSQLAEMQATDTLLDRLGRRCPAPEDLADPVFAALAGLAHEVDAVDPSQDAAVARLIEVLDGRPLWVLEGEDLSDIDGTQDMIVLDDPAWESGSQVIDLRQEAGDTAPEAGSEEAAAEGQDDAATAEDPDDAGERDSDVAAADETPQVAAEAADPTGHAADDAEPGSRVAAPPTVPIARPTLPAEPDAGHDDGDTAELPAAARVADDADRGPAVVRALRLPGRQRDGERREEPSWERTIRRATLPAAAAIAIFTVSGAVTAALTGDPMAPLTGVSRVVDSISGDGDSGERTTYAALQQNLEQAEGALASGDVEQAKALVQSARDRLDDVPPAEQAKLQAQIQDVQEMIAAKTPTTAPAPSASATNAPVAKPSPTTPEPSKTTDPEPSDDPSVEPSATVEPSETPEPTDPEPTEQPSISTSGADGSTTDG
jgi:hypothetical protein